MSATIDTTLFSNYFNNCPIIEVAGKTYPIQGRKETLVCKTIHSGCTIYGIVVIIGASVYYGVGSIYSVDWTTGQGYWIGLLDSHFSSKISIILCASYSWKLQITTPLITLLISM